MEKKKPLSTMPEIAPTTHDLRRIEQWEPWQFGRLPEFLRSRWNFSHGASLGQKLYKGLQAFELVTGNVSTNNSLVAALGRNRAFWEAFWLASFRGGRFVFRPLVNLPSTASEVEASDVGE